MKRGIGRRAILIVGICCVLQVACRPPSTSDRSYVKIEGPTISPDGRMVVFGVDRRKVDGGILNSDLTLLTLRDRSARTLLHTQPRLSKRPRADSSDFPYPYSEAWYGLAWSPDSNTFFGTVVEEEGFTIWSFPLPSGEPRRILSFPQRVCQRPRVSPDGEWIAFLRSPEAVLYRVKADGSELKRLTFHGRVYRLGYDWSPDSKYIYFSRRRDGRSLDGEIARINSDGAGETVILRDYYPCNLLVSPSGSYIAFNLITYAPGYDLLVYRIGDAKPLPVASRAEQFFSWHPNADELLYVHRNTLCVWEASTASSKTLPVTGDIGFPVITPDGKTILFLKRDGMNTFLWKLDVPSGKTERLYPPVAAGP